MNAVTLTVPPFLLCDDPEVVGEAVDEVVPVGVSGQIVWYSVREGVLRVYSTVVVIGIRISETLSLGGSSSIIAEQESITIDPVSGLMVASQAVVVPMTTADAVRVIWAVAKKVDGACVITVPNSTAVGTNEQTAWDIEPTARA